MPTSISTATIFQVRTSSINGEKNHCVLLLFACPLSNDGDCLQFLLKSGSSAGERISVDFRESSELSDESSGQLR